MKKADHLEAMIRREDSRLSRQRRHTAELAAEVTAMERAIKGWLSGVWSDTDYRDVESVFLLGAASWTPLEIEDSDSIKRETAREWLHRCEAARQRAWRISLARMWMADAVDPGGPAFVGGDNPEAVRRYWVRLACDDEGVQREEDRLHYPFEWGMS